MSRGEPIGPLAAETLHELVDEKDMLYRERDELRKQVDWLHGEVAATREIWRDWKALARRQQATIDALRDETKRLRTARDTLQAQLGFAGRKIQELKEELALAEVELEGGDQ